MRTLVYQLPLFALFFGIDALNLNADPIQDINQSMSSPDPSARASAMQHFVSSLGTVNGEALMGPAIPVLVAALNDSSVRVRQFGAAGLRGIAAVTMRILVPANPKLPDLTTSPQAKQALLAATSDADPIVRQMALEAYALTYKLTPDLEQKIIDTFNSYKQVPGQPDDRSALLGSLVNDRSPSPVATNFIVQKIDDPQFGIVALQSLASLKEPPPEVLPKLLNEVSQHNISEPRKSTLIRAIKAYGPDAQVQLEQILANPR